MSNLAAIISPPRFIRLYAGAVKLVSLIAFVALLASFGVIIARQPEEVISAGLLILVLLGLPALLFIMARGVERRQMWARLLAMAVHGLQVILSLFQILDGGGLLQNGNILNVVVGAALFAWFLRHGACFEAKTGPDMG